MSNQNTNPEIGQTAGVSLVPDNVDPPFNQNNPKDTRQFLSLDVETEKKLRPRDEQVETPTRRWNWDRRDQPEHRRNMEAVYGVSYDEALRVDRGQWRKITKLIPQRNKKSITNFPAHHAARMGNVEELARLLESENFNVFRQDYSKKRTILHEAAAYGNQQAALAMTNLILNSNYFLKSTEAHKDKANLINIQDKIGETCLHIAAKNRHRKVVERLLFSAADVNLKSEDGKEPIELIYQHVPQVMSAIFDQGIRCSSGEIYEDNFEVAFNFGAIIGVPDEKKLESEIIDEETELLIYALNGNEKKCGEILVHPLVQIFLQQKWKKIRFILITSILFHIAWLVIYSIFVMDLYVYKCPYFPNNQSQIFDKQQNTTVEISSGAIICRWKDLENANMISLMTMLFLITIIVGLKEVYEMFSLPNLKQYFFNLENIGQILIIVLIFLTASPVLIYANAEAVLLRPFHYQSAAFGVLVGWTLILSQIGKVPQLGIYVEILKKVLKSFGMFMITFISLIAGFAFAFSILLPRREMFRPHLAFAKLLVMMTGELNYDEIFYDEDDKDVIPFILSGQILFATFTIIVTIILFNLLIGLTVSDITGLQDKAHVSRLSSQLEQIYLMETFLFSQNMQKLTKFLKCDKLFRNKFLVSPPRRPKKVKTHRSRLRRQTEVDQDDLINENQNALLETDGHGDTNDTIMYSAVCEPEKKKKFSFFPSDRPENVPQGLLDAPKITETDRSVEKLGSLYPNEDFENKRKSQIIPEEAEPESTQVVILPIKKIPKDLVKEVRKLAAANTYSKDASVSEHIEVVPTKPVEAEELRIQIKKIMDDLEKILIRINNNSTNETTV